MVKAQVQFPDHLYKEAKRISAEYEMSFAEVVRRGVEEATKAYPPGRVPADIWTLPEASEMGEPLLPESEWEMASCEEV